GPGAARVCGCTEGILHPEGRMQGDHAGSAAGGAGGRGFGAEGSADVHAAGRTWGTLALIDDDPAVRRALRRVLVSMGYSVRCFGSAEEYLDARPRAAFRCLLVDVNLPGMSGTELFLRLSAAPDAPPVILLSSDPSAGLALRGRVGPTAP